MKRQLFADNVAQFLASASALTAAPLFYSSLFLLLFLTQHPAADRQDD